MGYAATAQDIEKEEESTANVHDRSSEDFYVEEDAEPGAFFIDHKVMQGEQVAMICRRYMLEPADIYLFNSDAVNGIAKGTVLKIPLHRSKKKDLDGFIKELEKKNGGSPQVAAPQKRKKMGVM
ncbi:hypothetical protein HYN59_10865 [Flavobacterium album]|uniref:LysM domain-containing protein n=1 Tax=Flavobacterium album TaxID=2175091 RepID=A0A2S1QYV6_9FLAO|nr:hypothetical protein HYN59_10865 [Flavobacterium album]